MIERKKLLLRLDPVVHDALARWASDELRSTNSQIEFLLRRALSEAGRLPEGVGRMRPRGRPRSSPEGDSAAEGSEEEGERTDGDTGEAG
ncbi:hypothetical protein GCM10009850_101040 [Nonomuraea monospora]|uniref:Toxin-antitoxin system HicB family antitoxin n=1 Tax=Nonomuraea monospora TaxID=568818 RepID=A0ABP5PSK7_9ACTN